jgi:hypothetical protein
MSIHVPDYKLEPPEDTRKEVYHCTICDEPIYEGDDYYNIPGLGPCCETCIDESKRYDAEVDYPECDREEV